MVILLSKNMRRVILLTASLTPFLILLYFIGTQDRFAHFNMRQFILDSFFSLEEVRGIEKDASAKTVDCIDWNLVIDLSSHPLGSPYSPDWSGLSSGST